MSNKKVARNEALIKYFQAHPDITMHELATQFPPIKRQRAHAIIQAYKREQATEEHLIIPIATTTEPVQHQ